MSTNKKIQVKVLAFIEAVTKGVFVTPDVTTNGVIRDANWWIDLDPRVPNVYPPKRVYMELLQGMNDGDIINVDVVEGTIHRIGDSIYVSLVLPDQSTIDCSFTERAVSVSLVDLEE